MKNRDSSAEWRQLWYLVYAFGVAAILVFWWRATGHATIGTTYSVNLAIGNITGLIGAYAILWELVLLGRLPVLENVFGMEKLTVLHKWNGYTALTLILVHALTLTIGFAAADHYSLLHQFLAFNTTWADILKSTVGTILLIVIVGMSVGIVRRGYKYETWYYVHLFTYLAILLAFGHQFSDGSDFVGQPLFIVFWRDLYIVTAALLLFFRFFRPVYLMFRHQFKVARVVQETPDVVSVYISGRHLDKFKFVPGQFVIWRFFTKDGWWQAHPFSFSTAPNPKYLRLTAKAVGDYTKTLPSLRPGTWVSVDGPHGNFTTSRLTMPSLLMIAGGSGITPIRAMLERLPAVVKDLVVIYAVRTRRDLALAKEIEPLVAARGGQVKYLLSKEQAPGFGHGILNSANLDHLVPDVASREIMLCGPPAMTDSVVAMLKKRGIDHHHIHTERFAY